MTEKNNLNSEKKSIKRKKAVIVESPTKAKTILQLLPKGYQVKASYGHIRDLPKGRLGVDLENQYTPSYVIPRSKTKQVNAFKKDLKGYSLIYLATDPDREGEAIAYHIKELLKKDNPELKDDQFKRVVFHEITKDAVNDAFERPMMLNEKLYNAQTARRVLDRLVGYSLSPLLWEKIRKGLSAGRVQSVAVRLIVDREREIEAFKAQEYWEIEADFLNIEKVTFRAKLYKKGDITKKNGKISLKNQEETDTVRQDLEKGQYKIISVDQKKVQKSPYPPFITSTLQQTAVNLYGYSSKKTMQIAQSLFEKGIITYMRTDSFNLSESAVSKIRSFIENVHGKKFIPQYTQYYKNRSKVAQEAHEAIRPTDVEKTPETLSSSLEKDEFKLYSLIWKRTVACQMEKALYLQTAADIATTNLSINYIFRANGNQILFPGWKILYSEEDNNEHILPPLRVSDPAYLSNLYPQQKFTQPPARYTEASLIKALEDNDIGRPSTYAPTISTIMAREYVEKEDKKLKPTESGFVVTDFLVKYFPDIVNYDFTAEMEENLDRIARGEKEWVPIIDSFYKPFEKKISEVESTAEKIQLQEDLTDEICEKCGKPMVVKRGRFGKFLACSGYPDCKSTKPFVRKLDIACPECGSPLVVKMTKKRRKFYGCSNYPLCNYASWHKPKSENSENEEEKDSQE